MEQDEYRNYTGEDLSQLQSRANLAEMLNDFSIDQILACDTNNLVIACNKTCATIWEVDREDLIGKRIEEAFPSLFACDAMRDALENSQKGFKVFVPSYKCSYLGGYFEHHFIPIQQDQVSSGVLIIIHDVAHRIKTENDLKRLNRELAKKNKELEHRNEEILSFSHVTGHDLKEPLRKIYLFLEMILKEEGEKFSKKAKSYFKRVQSSAQRMGLLTDDMLAISTLDTKNPSSEVSLNEVFKNTKDSLHEQITAKNAIIEADNLPVIKGYEKMLFQLFHNLISNGLKFQEAGNVPYIAVHTAFERGNIIQSSNFSGDESDVAYHVISFTDNGIGFDTQYSEKIFQMFQRLNDSTAYPGTGIGLALCKKIIEIHNGFIIVESAPGGGSTFRCYFPVAAR